MSRRKTNSVERTSATPSDEDVELEQQERNQQPVELRRDPFQAMNPATTTGLTANVIAAVTVADAGTIARGKASLRTSDSFATIDVIPSDVASSKNVKSTIPIRSASG